MSKIIVPQELQDKIIDLYVNKQYNRPQIKRELNLSFGDSVIVRILKENNIEIRSNPGAKVAGRKKQEVSREIQDKVIEAYNQGYGLEKIVEILNLPFSFDKVRSILQDNGIKIRTVKESAQVKKMPDLRKYSINDDYELESHNGAWLLGFIAADGYLPVSNSAHNRITITLARQDEEVLNLITKELNYNGKIYQFDATGGYPASSLSFTSKKLRQKIESYGIGNNKTFKLNHLPNLPDEYMIDFIRGFFDGDGSLYEPKGKKINMNITCASKNFLEEIAKYLHNHYNVSDPIINEQIRVHPVYDIRYYVKDSFILGDLFYDNDYLSLPRKKKHYLEIKARYNY